MRVRKVPATPYPWPIASPTFASTDTALLVVDMQRDFLDPRGYLAAQGYDVLGLRRIIPRVHRLLQLCRRLGLAVYFTREGHRPDLSTLGVRELARSRNNSRRLGIGDAGELGRFLVRGEPGHGIVPELSPTQDDERYEAVIDKPGKGAFAHTDLELLLRNRGIKNIILAGVTTDVCVHTTLREANDRGFDCLLLEDCCAAADPKLHDAAISTVHGEGGIFGATALLADLETLLGSDLD